MKSARDGPQKRIHLLPPIRVVHSHWCARGAGDRIGRAKEVGEEARCEQKGWRSQRCGQRGVVWRIPFEPPRHEACDHKNRFIEGVLAGKCPLKHATAWAADRVMQCLHESRRGEARRVNSAHTPTAHRLSRWSGIACGFDVLRITIRNHNEYAGKSHLTSRTVATA